MIFGKTDKERKNKIKPYWFAWYPVKLRDGRWIWWDKVKRYKCVDYTDNGLMFPERIILYVYDIYIG